MLEEIPAIYNRELYTIKKNCLPGCYEVLVEEV